MPDIRERHVPCCDGKDHNGVPHEHPRCTRCRDLWPCYGYRADKAEAALAECQHNLAFAHDRERVHREAATKAEAALAECIDRMSLAIIAAQDDLAAARADAKALAAMLSEAAWAIDHTCTQCGDRQPSHTPRCPTYIALAAHKKATK